MNQHASQSAPQQFPQLIFESRPLSEVPAHRLFAYLVDMDPANGLMPYLQHLLGRRFLAHSLGRRASGFEYIPIIFQLAVSYYHRTLPALSPEELGELVFEVLPCGDIVPPNDAPKLIAQLRTLYRFFAKRCRLTEVDRFMSLLGPGATEELAAALADRAQAKGVVSIGRPAAPGDTLGRRRAQSRKTKKAKRKSIRAARRRNRSR